MTYTETQMEALGILQEECAEIIKEISKIRRSGPDYNPHGGEVTNAQNLALEIGDFLTVLEFCPKDAVTPPEGFRERKIEKLKKWSGIVPGARFRRMHAERVDGLHLDGLISYQDRHGANQVLWVKWAGPSSPNSFRVINGGWYGTIGEDGSLSDMAGIVSLDATVVWQGDCPHKTTEPLAGLVWMSIRGSKQRKEDV